MRLYFSDLCALWLIEHPLIFNFVSSTIYTLFLSQDIAILPNHFYDLIKLKSERSNLLSVTWIAEGDESQPIQFLPSFCATTNVVPEPQKKSATRSLALQNCPIILSNNCSCFSVSYPVE